jgi:anti-anti-sigma regulatory factor
MTSRMTVRIEGSRVVLAGRIDDSAQLAELAAKLAPGDVTIDSDAVTFVNSIGMRELVRLIRALRGGGRRVMLERVADVLITQVNMLPELAQAVTVTSFHAQYECPSCGAEHAPLVHVTLHAQLLRNNVAPQLPCPECGKPSELADFPERYLSIFRPLPQP